jgi:hypothetical protein
MGWEMRGLRVEWCQPLAAPDARLYPPPAFALQMSKKEIDMLFEISIVSTSSVMTINDDNDDNSVQFNSSFIYVLIHQPKGQL